MLKTAIDLNGKFQLSVNMTVNPRWKATFPCMCGCPAISQINWRCYTWERRGGFMCLCFPLTTFTPIAQWCSNTCHYPSWGFEENSSPETALNHVRRHRLHVVGKAMSSPHGYPFQHLGFFPKTSLVSHFESQSQMKSDLIK